MTGLISISGLSKAYRKYPNQWQRLFEWLHPSGSVRHTLHWILRDISFDVMPGETVGIMGINGSGKSTLLKMIAGTLSPTRGTIVTEGRVSALLELGMGFNQEFTGRQNARMSAQLYGLSEVESQKILPEVEDFAEIGEYFDQPLRIYSTGMQVRLAFSVATAVRPAILIVDEALSVGDAYFQAKCYKRIAQYINEGTTLLLVSHSVGDVVKHCNRAILIKDGKIVKDGTSREVSNLYLGQLFGNTNNSLMPMPMSIRHELFSAGSEDLYSSRPGYNKEEYRWGNGGAKIIDYTVLVSDQEYPSEIESGVEVEFYFKVVFHQAFEHIIPGFLIKTIEGIFLYGTNSLIAQEIPHLASAEIGQTAIYRFTVSAALNEGYYLVSFGISTGNAINDLSPVDRRYDSLMIKIVRGRSFVGIVDLHAKFCDTGSEAQ